MNNKTQTYQLLLNVTISTPPLRHQKRTREIEDEVEDKKDTNEDVYDKMVIKIKNNVVDNCAVKKMPGFNEVIVCLLQLTIYMSWKHVQMRSVKYEK
jgi:hypothetical protein